MSAELKVTSGFAPSGDGQIYFEAAGSGPALVFVHAGVSDRRMWDPQFEAFAGDYRVIRFDLRGFGKSSQPDGSFSNRDDLAAVLAATGVDKAVLVGCSMGGAATIDFTLVNPAAVRGLVPVGAGVSGWKDWSPQTFKQFEELMRLIQAGDVDGARESDARYWIDGPGRDAAKVEPTYRGRALELHRANFADDRFARPEQELAPPAIGELAEIKCPTMVVVGDADSDDLKLLAAQIAREVDGARLVTIENAAHLPSLEHPGQFNHVLRQFFARLSK